MVLIAFLVAVAVRVSVGSATVSMTMAAGIIASMPMVAGLQPASVSSAYNRNRSRWNSIQSCKRLRILAVKIFVRGR